MTGETYGPKPSYCNERDEAANSSAGHGGLETKTIALGSDSSRKISLHNPIIGPCWYLREDFDQPDPDLL